MTAAEYPPLREIRAHVCTACIAREGSECHTPGCLFWLHSVEDLPPNLDIYVDPPADLPATLATVDDVRRVCEAAGLDRVLMPGRFPDRWLADGVDVHPFVLDDVLQRTTVIAEDPATQKFAWHAEHGRNAPAVLLWHTIQAARSTS